MEGSSVGTDPVALQPSVWLALEGHSPALLSLELRSMPPVPGPLPRLSEAPSGLLRAGWLQTPSSQAPSRSSVDSCCQLAPGASTQDRVGHFPVGLKEGHALSPQPSHHSGSPTTIWGRDENKRLFLMYLLISRTALATT